MEKMFNIQKIKKGIYLAREPFYKECANVFIVKGKREDLVVDTGTGFGNIKAFLVSQGFGPFRIFITHSHYDHAGGARHFAKNEIYAGANTITRAKQKKYSGAEYLRAEDFRKTAVKNFWKISPEQLCEAWEPPKRVAREAGKVMEVEPYAFSVIYAPGHTDDSYILYERQKKILITGDALYDGKPYANLPNSNPRLWIKTLDKIKKLKWEIMLPGHNNVIIEKKEGKQVIARWTKMLRHPELKI